LPQKNAKIAKKAQSQDDSPANGLWVNVPGGDRDHEARLRKAGGWRGLSLSNELFDPT
jgi:hypothetical protein